jgi:hypothetical protein
MLERERVSYLRWSTWTRAKLTGDDLTSFVTGDLFPHLRDLAGTPQAEKVAELFRGVTTVMKSGYVLAEVIDIIDRVDFHAADEYHAMSVLYETLLAQMGGDSGLEGFTEVPAQQLLSLSAEETFRSGGVHETSTAPNVRQLTMPRTLSASGLAGSAATST